MSRLKRAEPVLNAAEQWKKRCLLDSGSIFTEERLWSRENFEQLRIHFVENPDEGPDSFHDKLQRQLEPASPEAKRLWAEMTWVLYLIVSSLKRRTKVSDISMVWEWSGSALPDDHWALGEILEQGIVNPGAAYNTNRWREFVFFITAMIDWFSLSEGDRKSLISDPWRFAEWLERREHAHARQFRHAFLFLLFPDSFESILSRKNKVEIVKAFSRKWKKEPAVDYKDRIAVDRALFNVRERIIDEHPGQEIDFYRSPFSDVWKSPPSSPPSSPQEPPPTEESDEAWFRQRFGEVDVWAISPGEGARLWPDFQENGIAAIGWDELGNIRTYDSRDAVHEALVDDGYGSNPKNNARALWEFANEVKIGDIIIAKRGRSSILGWGTVTGEYELDPDRPEYQNVRTVEWTPCKEPIALPQSRRITNKTLTRFSPYKNWLRFTFGLIEGEAPDGKVGPAPYDMNAALEDVFVSRDQLKRILDSIALRKNIILQGPPGVGKTFIARRIAWCLIGRNDSRPVEIVQFHQSYAYEDFVQGWRPTENGGFALRNGVFFEFCKRAEKQLDTPFVFIIDEINRGNLSRIFGELLMLIEADKRGSNFAIPLTYSTAGERFSVPANMHLLGLMNTADRSLAMVDYALRRRFAFEALRPAYHTEQFKEYLINKGADEPLVMLIVDRMSAINDHIREDKDLGSGFEIGHSYFVPGEEETLDELWFHTIVDTQIEPLLREYWFDRPERVDELLTILKQ